MAKWHFWWIGWLTAVLGVSWFSNDYLVDNFGNGRLFQIFSLLGGALLIGLIILFFHDFFQTANPVQRRFPVLYWGRWVSVHLGPLLRQYWFANDLEEKPFNRVTRNWVYSTSKGKNNTIGFGSQVDFDAVGTYTVMPSMFKRKENEHEGYHRVIGEHTGVKNTVTLKHFVHISAMSFGSLSSRAVSALNKGAGKV